jgi:hypothetical protein
LPIEPFINAFNLWFVRAWFLFIAPQYQIFLETVHLENNGDQVALLIVLKQELPTTTDIYDASYRPEYSPFNGLVMTNTAATQSMEQNFILAPCK